MSFNTTAAATRTTTGLRELAAQKAQTAEVQAPQVQQVQQAALVQPAVLRQPASPEAVAQSRSRAGMLDAAAQMRLMQGVTVPGDLEGLQMVHHRPDHGAGIVAHPPRPEFPRPGQPRPELPQPGAPRPPQFPMPPDGTRPQAPQFPRPINA